MAIPSAAQFLDKHFGGFITKVKQEITICCSSDMLFLVGGYIPLTLMLLSHNVLEEELENLLCLILGSVHTLFKDVHFHC